MAQQPRIVPVRPELVPVLHALAPDHVTRARIERDLKYMVSVSEAGYWTRSGANWPWRTLNTFENAERLMAQEILPSDWLDHADSKYPPSAPRSFASAGKCANGCTRSRRNRCDRLGWCSEHAGWPYPPDNAVLATIASLGLEQIARVEALAAETCARLADRGCEPLRNVLWRVEKLGNLFAGSTSVVYVGPKGTARVMYDCLTSDGRWFAGDVDEPVPFGPARDLWEMGVPLHLVADGVVTVTVPPLASASE